MVNITFTEAELFFIKCSINQAVNIPGISKITITTDSIHAMKRIFDSSLHLFQIHVVSISNELREFFLLSTNNSIKFWECLSHCNWSLYKTVDRETKQSHQIPLFPCKLSWDFRKKSEYNNIIKNWKMTFQALDLRGHQFLDLVNDNNNPIKPSYVNGGSQLKYFEHYNFLYARVMRVIVNHAPISEYRLRSFLREKFKCPYSLYSIKSRCHILQECKRFNKYWNPRRDTISHFSLFLELNSDAFAFENAITLLQQLSLHPTLFLLCPFFFSLFFFLFFSLSISFSSCSLGCFVHNYKVATTVCLCAPCDKLLIFKNKKSSNINSRKTKTYIFNNFGSTELDKLNNFLFCHIPCSDLIYPNP